MIGAVLLLWLQVLPSSLAGSMSFTGKRLSTIAIDVATGQIKGHFQYTPNESFDWDEVSPPILVDFQRNGRTVKGLIDACRKLEPKLGCLLADLCFGAPQEGRNVADRASVLNPVAEREQVVLGPFSVEIRLIGHAIHPNSRALSLASL